MTGGPGICEAFELAALNFAAFNFLLCRTKKAPVAVPLLSWQVWKMRSDRRAPPKLFSVFREQTAVRHWRSERNVLASHNYRNTAERAKSTLIGLRIMDDPDL